MVRVQFAGAVYPVMARGNERRHNFRDDRDRQRFWEMLGEMAERFWVRGVGALPDAQSLPPGSTPGPARARAAGTEGELES
jgi:hypothetical protein